MTSRLVTVNFRGTDLYSFENDDGVFVAVKPIVDAMGVDWNAQRQRIRRDPILSEGACIIPAPLAKGGIQETTCLKLELVNGWLFTIDASRIKDEGVRERVILYQRECYQVLTRHFHRPAGAPPVEIPSGDQPHEPDGPRVRLVSEARQVFGTRAAGELWFKLGLPITPSMTEARKQLDLLDYSRIRTNEGEGSR
ncbi:hypothetical protein NS226_15310 [Aureimonas ureilytica]|uniref:Antirepressor protein ant N-terminal domain-containing protein n=1 Tax=Aureimonas ureilytica TaxID=401562 RepID=A0A175R893_9HYPH|nr:MULTISPECIES: phage antirepressor N-terminal domain-containing protein [Aureimonas]KTQ92657.1 hypothetical protein NS226_15310 [Aureimonas ureilytica]